MYGENYSYNYGGYKESDNPPKIDRFDIKNKSNNVWAKFQIDWEVSDIDGDLEKITSVLNLGTDTHSTNISGESDYGKHRLRERRGEDWYDVILTLTDSDGNDVTEEKSIYLGDAQ
jgi:subtilisin